jgi:hypothetical protein
VAPKRPRQIPSPTVANYGGVGRELGRSLADLAATPPATAARPRRTASNNPSRVSTEHLRVAPLSTYEQTVLDFGDPFFDAAVENAETSAKEYLSPPPTSDEPRPRAREAVYDPTDRSLQVRFRNGGTYTYFGVPRKDWNALKRNQSFGRTLDRLIIGTYPFRKTSVY